VATDGSSGYSGFSLKIIKNILTGEILNMVEHKNTQILALTVDSEPNKEIFA
jgi:hypothetical protein